MAVPAALVAHYRQLLGLVKPWKITDITLDVARERLDITLEWPQGQKAPCPECGKRCGLKDHLPERTWRHLDTLQFKTFLHCRIPRSACSAQRVFRARGEDDYRALGGIGIAVDPDVRGVCGDGYGARSHR